MNEYLKIAVSYFLTAVRMISMSAQSVSAQSQDCGSFSLPWAKKNPRF